jgi:hypothetical protein
VTSQHSTAPRDVGFIVLALSFLLGESCDEARVACRGRTSQRNAAASKTLETAYSGQNFPAKQNLKASDDGVHHSELLAFWTLSVVLCSM